MKQQQFRLTIEGATASTVVDRKFVAECLRDARKQAPIGGAAWRAEGVGFRLCYERHGPRVTFTPMLWQEEMQRPERKQHYCRNCGGRGYRDDLQALCQPCNGTGKEIRS